MARIRPFAAWRYTGHGTDLTPVTAPPYDVISEEQRLSLLAKDEHNVVALELPDGSLEPDVPGNRYETGKTTWDAWRADGTLARDPAPRLYVIEQRYTLGEREIRRRAFVVEVALEPFDAGIILPHERTLPKALGDRFELIKATGANLSQVFGMYDDPDRSSEECFLAVMATEPVATASDEDGVVSSLWATADEKIAAQLAELLSDRRIFIADGHHRYTTALAYRDMRRAQAEEQGSSPENPAYDWVMMALVNMDDPDLVVLPTHRVADAPGFDPDAFKTALAEHFILEKIEGHPHNALDGVDEPAMIVRTRDDEAPFLVRLRPGVDLEAAIGLGRSAAWNSLDVTVLQELVLRPLLGIHPDTPQTLERLSFVKDAHKALEATREHDVAFVLRTTRMDQLRDVALAGETMPQKSTYFYPKLLSGLVLRSAE